MVWYGCRCCSHTCCLGSVACTHGTTGANNISADHLSSRLLCWLLVYAQYCILQYIAWSSVLLWLQRVSNAEQPPLFHHSLPPGHSCCCRLVNAQLRGSVSVYCSLSYQEVFRKPRVRFFLYRFLIRSGAGLWQQPIGDSGIRSGAKSYPPQSCTEACSSQ